jgi:hypothetical protein
MVMGGNEKLSKIIIDMMVRGVCWRGARERAADGGGCPLGD